MFLKELQQQVCILRALPRVRMMYCVVTGNLMEKGSLSLGKNNPEWRGMVLQTLSRCLMRPNLTNTKLIRPLLEACLCCALKLLTVTRFGSPAESLPRRDLGSSRSQGLISTKTENLAWYFSVMQKSWRLTEYNGGVSLYASEVCALPMAFGCSWRETLCWMSFGYGHSGARSTELASPFCLSAGEHFKVPSVPFRREEMLLVLENGFFPFSSLV